MLHRPARALIIIIVYPHASCTLLKVMRFIALIMTWVFHRRIFFISLKFFSFELLVRTRIKMYVRLNQSCKKCLSADSPAKTKNRVHDPVVSHIFGNRVCVCYVFYMSEGIFFRPNLVEVLIVFFLFIIVLLLPCVIISSFLQRRLVIKSN